MLFIGGIGDFVHDAFLNIFLELLDTVVYSLLASLYLVWELIAKIDIFGGGSGGQVIYDTFTARIYTFIAIVMVFIFAYRLLCYIMDPDGSSKSGTSASTMIKNILTSVIMVVLAPLVFKYMSVFQYHVVANNTIPSIVLGTNGANEVIPSGKQLSMITLMSFYHPLDANYNTFVKNPNGGSCEEIIEIPAFAGNQCQSVWGTVMMDWCKQNDHAPDEITTNDDLQGWVGEDEGATYMWVVCTGAGVAVCYFLVQYCLALGARAARLGFLQIIAPVPLLLRIFDKGSYFDPWFKEIKKTYLELFLRIAIISFVIFLCTLVPSILNAIFHAV